MSTTDDIKVSSHCHPRDRQSILVKKCATKNRVTLMNLSPQGCNMYQFIKDLWQAWNEARMGYANRYRKHRLGS